MLTSKFDAALVFASELHREQQRKGTPVPYVSHLLAVTALLLEDQGSEDEAIAALLHDAVEDQGDTYPGGRAKLRQDIAERFGAPVLSIVDACTDDEGHEKGHAATLEEERRRWKLRKEEYIARIAHKNVPELRVLCADKVHNSDRILFDYAKMGEDIWLRFRTRARESQIWYYNALADAIDARFHELGVDSDLAKRVRLNAERMAAIVV